MTVRSLLRRHLRPVLALIVVALAGGACAGGDSSAATEGISDRVTPTTVEVSARTVGGSDCFKSSAVLPAGRDASGTPHYLVTMVLKSNPVDEVALLRAIEGPTCQQALQTTVASVTDTVTKNGAKAAVTVSYRTEKGRRFTLPG